MSKAFTREDDRPEPELPKRLPSPLPPGAKNYMTPDGARRLRVELDALVKTTGARSPTVDERIHQLTRCLESAVVVEPPSDDLDVVRFGATVSIRTLPDGPTVRYRIVGVDETDVARGWISWVSPVAKALISASVGDRVRAALPSGEVELEILEVMYS
jgi:transcription elongation factor GreB